MKTRRGTEINSCLEDIKSKIISIKEDFDELTLGEGSSSWDLLMAKNVRDDLTCLISDINYEIFA